MKRIEECFDKAEKAAAADKAALERVKFMRRELWGKVAEGRKAYDKANSDRAIWKAYMTETAEKITIDGKINEKVWSKAKPFHMIPRKGSVNEVNTVVRLLKDKENFYVAVESEEPFTDKMICADRKKDEVMIWQDNLVELFFSPGRRSELMYQIMISSNGCISDMRTVVKHDYKWESNTEYKIGIVPGKKWIMECRIPLSSMPEIKDAKEFVGNFTRGRVIKGEKVMAYYVWTPFPRHNPENCGTIQVVNGPVADTSVIKFGDFEEPILSKRFLGAWGSTNNWFAREKLQKDTRIFRTGGASLRFEKTTPASEAICQYLPALKPNTKYKFSYMVRLENVKAQGKGGFNLNIRMGGEGNRHQTLAFPGASMTGTNDWVRFEHEFTSTPDVGKKHRPYVGLYMSNATGTVWIDNVKLVEVK